MIWSFAAGVAAPTSLNISGLTLEKYASVRKDVRYCRWVSSTDAEGGGARCDGWREVRNVMIREDSVSVHVLSGVEAGVYCKTGTRPR